MLKTLIQKEILNNLLNLRFSLAYGLCALLLVGSSAVMLSDYLEEVRSYTANRNVYEADFHSKTQKWNYLWGAKKVARQPVITKLFAIGGEKDPDLRAEVAPEFSPYFKGDFKRNPLVNLIPTLDMVFIVGVILSLLIFVLTYDSISGEREQGTLKILLSCGVPRDTIIMAKWMGGYISLIIPFVVSFLLISLLLLFAPEISISGTDWIRIMGIFGICLLFIAVVFSLSVMTSILSAQSSTAVLVLLVAWVFGIIIIPSSAPAIAYLLISPTGVEQHQIKYRDIGVVGWVRSEEEQDKYLKAQFGGKTREELSMVERQRWDEIKRNYWLIHLTNMVNDITEEGQKEFRDQKRMAGITRWMARISPYGCLQNAATSIAGTDLSREQMLREGVEDFNKKHVAYFRKIHSEGKDRIIPSSGPVFHFEKPALSDGLARALPDIGVLIFMGGLFFMLGYLAFLKSEVT